MITTDGKHEQVIEQRVGRSKNGGCNEDGGSRETRATKMPRLRVFNAIVVPTVMYVCTFVYEMWTMLKKHESKIAGV